MKRIWSTHFLIALFGYFFLFMSVTLFFIFPLFFQQFNAPKSRIGFIMGVHSLVAIFVRPLIGRLVDLKGRKQISLFGIVFLIFVLPFFHFIRDAGTLPVILRALTGLGWGISMTATLTICSDLAPVERLAESMGIIGVAGLVSSAIGPMLAEEIVRIFGFPGLFNAGLAFLVASFLCIYFTNEVSKPNNNGRKFHRPRSLQNVSYLIIALLALLPIAHGAIRGAVVYFIALFGKSIPLERVGPFFLFFSGAAIIARLFFGNISDRYGRKQVIIPSVIIISLNLILIACIKSNTMLFLTGFIGGFGQGLVFPALSTYIIDIFGIENKGLAISLYLTFFDIGMGGGSVFFGWISDLYGYRIMYVCAAVILFLVCVIFSIKAPSSPDFRKSA